MERDDRGALGRDLPAGETVEAVETRAPDARRGKRRVNDYKVILDMPEPLPVTQAELELLEMELADFIAELLKK